MRTALLLAALSSSTALAAPTVNDPTDPGNPGGGFDPGPTDTEICQRAIFDKNVALSSSGINLGAQAGPITLVGLHGWCYQAFQFGRIHTAPYAGSQVAVIFGDVLSKFLALGAEPVMGRTLADPVRNNFTGVVTQRFIGGVILVHPSFGIRVIRNPLSVLWSENGEQARFGFPTTDTLPTVLGSYNQLERGYVARTDDMGSWIDFTGQGEGRVNASISLYQDVGLTGSVITRSLSGESPVALRPQFGALDNLTSSLTIQMPTQTSLFLYDESPLEGRFLRITGADNSLIRVSSIGSFMNDRPSSMVFVNHGTVSAKSSIAALAAQIESALDGLDTEPLIAQALAGHDASGSLTWSGPVSVTLLPGERLIQFHRRAYMNIDAGCALIFNCNADGYVDFSVTVRPFVANGDNSVHVDFVEGNAISVSCSGEACGDRNSALEDLFDSLTVRDMIEATFNASIDDKLSRLGLLQTQCSEIGVRRVNVMPESLEIVVADTVAAATCAQPFDINGELDFARPVAQVTVRNPTPTFPPTIPTFNGTVTVVPNFQPTPPVIKK